MLHLLTAGIQAVCGGGCQIRTAQQHIVKLLIGGGCINGCSTGLDCNLIALCPLSPIGQQHAALGCTHKRSLAVCGGCTNRTAGNIRSGNAGQTPVATCQQGTGRNVNGGFRLNSIIPGLDAYIAAGDIHIRLGRLDAVSGGVDLHRTVLDAHTLLCPDTVHLGGGIFRNDSNITAGDFEIVVAVDAILGGCGHNQCTLPLDGHIILGINGCGIFCIGGAVIHIIGGTCNQVQRGVFRILNQDRGSGNAGDVHAVEEQLDSFSIRHNIRYIDYDLSIRQSTVNIITTGCVNGHRFIAVAQRSVIPLYFNKSVLQVDICRLSLRGGSQHLTLEQCKIYAVQHTVSVDIPVFCCRCSEGRFPDQILLQSGHILCIHSAVQVYIACNRGCCADGCAGANHTAGTQNAQRQHTGKHSAPVCFPRLHDHLLLYSIILAYRMGFLRHCLDTGIRPGFCQYT